jgi:hypothetical protein
VNLTAPKVEPADYWLTHIEKGLEQVPEYITPKPLLCMGGLIFPLAGTNLYLSRKYQCWEVINFFS